MQVSSNNKRAYSYQHTLLLSYGVKQQPVHSQDQGEHGEDDQNLKEDAAALCVHQVAIIHNHGALLPPADRSSGPCSWPPESAGPA